LAWIHQLQQTAVEAGIAQVPRIVPSLRGTTYVADDQRMLWELTRWMPGVADFHRCPSRQRLVAAIDLLARLHLAVAPLTASQPNVPSAAVAQRLEYTQWLLDVGSSRLRDALRGGPHDALGEFAQQIIANFHSAAPPVVRQLMAWKDVPVPHQACLRDIWHDHVLFDREEVTGLVDYGAARVETPLLDLARLVGSLVGDDAAEWRSALDCYRLRCPLVQPYLALCGVFDAASALLSGMQWLDWLLLQRRLFDDPQKVWARLHEHGARLVQLEQRQGQPVLPSLTVGGWT
jgi:Ser/Thr protein kinase RdoA (MazF antagonist)